MSGVHALVLAAGSARRFGAAKLLAPFRGGALIDAALGAALKAPVSSVVVTTGAGAEAVAARVRAVAPGAVLVHASDHAEGMAASLRAGIAGLPPTAEGVLIFLGDMPDIPEEIPPKLVRALLAGAPAAAPSLAGRRGHPVGVTRSQFPALTALSGDEGARRVLEGLGEAVALVETDDPGVLADVDTPADLFALARR